MRKKSQARQHGFETLSDVCKERLRRAANKVKEENPQYTGDLGFRVFKLDTSNIRAWEPDGDDLEGTLLDNTDHIKPGRSQDDILYELLLKLGLDCAYPSRPEPSRARTCISSGPGR